MWYIHDGHNLHTLLNGILRAANQELIGSCNLSFIYPEHDLLSPFPPFYSFFFPEPRDYTVIRRRKIGISHLYTGCLVIEGLMPGFIRVVSRFQSFFYNYAYISKWLWIWTMIGQFFILQLSNCFIISSLIIQGKVNNNY